MCTKNVHINYNFLLSKILNSPNSCIKRATMCYPDCQNKKVLICAYSIISGVSIYASNEPLCGTLIARIKVTQFAHAQ